VKTILITGVAGFIGSNFAHYISSKYPNYDIVGVDNLSLFSNIENIIKIEESGQLIFFRANIADKSAMEKVYRDYDINFVVNFAAESHNDRAIIDPTKFVHTNVLGTQVLLELSRQYKVKRHIQISTIEVHNKKRIGTYFFNLKKAI
jgi:dTDP-glucose 4,6-dehydratase